MLSPDRLAMLRGFLGTLPANLAVRLAQAVEIDRLMAGTDLPHDVILDGLRPALRRAPPNGTRLPTPLRLFCQPVEDLFTTRARTKKQKARIARTSLAPVWNWLQRALLPKETAAFCEAITSLIVTGRTGEVQAQALAFWKLASDAMNNRFATDAGRKESRAALGDDKTIADAQEMALLLSVAPEILALQETLTRPVPELSDDLLWTVRRHYDRLVEVMPDAAPYVAVILMRRLERPWEALRLPLQIARQTRDTLIASTDMGLAGELLFSDLDEFASSILAARHPGFDAEVLIGSLASFAELSSAVVHEVDVRRDGKWGQGLLKDRADVSNAMIGFMERAPKEIANALPMRKTGSFASIRVPDFSRAVEPEKVESALRYARLVMGCRPFAAAASFAANQKDAHEESTQYLTRYVEDVVKEMRAADGQKRAIVESQFGIAIDLAAILLSEEEAEFLRRRGRAALSTAA